MNVLFAGGGTGGHVFPAVAVAEELVRRRGSTRLLFVGSDRGLEARIIPQRGYSFEAVAAGALKGIATSARLSTLVGLPRSIQKAGQIVERFSPQVVVGIGGYASAPVVVAATMQGRPRMILEQNAIPGLANRLLAYFVTRAAVNFPESLRYFPGNAVVTGNPVRQGFFRVGPPSREGEFTVLIFGGSQGAHAINAAMMEALPHLAEWRRRIRFIHQTGEKDAAWVETTYRANQFSAEVRPFFDDMPNQFSRAHWIIARSGASCLAEIAATGRPSLLIPFPSAADDHQRKNAEVFARRGASVVINQSSLNGERLALVIRLHMENKERQEQMSRAAASLSIPDAASRIADLVEALASKA
ncbi:MAG: undecaprenyldiphospho-muramoylpentapeptide beta-N-acetylglucosaminyltransferase [Acidobacteriia bacterium]|nr:undecaprenyldiphospho-muramoylpentapeptide beta-N-acetylglucosaminyltransferase [Terriglobia bacterium]